MQIWIIAVEKLPCHGERLNTCRISFWNENTPLFPQSRIFHAKLGPHITEGLTKRTEFILFEAAQYYHFAVPQAIILDAINCDLSYFVAILHPPPILQQL